MVRSSKAFLRNLLVVSVLAFAPTAAAQESAKSPEIVPTPPVGSEIGRYTFNPVIDGLMRLDSRTGQVSHCRRRGPSWSCETVADDRAAYEAEIARLAGKVAALEAELARQAAAEAPKPGAEPTPPVPPQTVPPSASKPSAPWPGDEEVERAMRYLEGLFRRFLTMVGKLRQELEPNRI
jgi:hypothetical protein